jgi:DNA-binding CsgD family transcriptional regulator
MRESFAALIVINAACEVKSSFIEPVGIEAAKRIFVAGESRLLPKLETAATALMSDEEERRTILDDGRVMRLLPLIGGGDTMYAVVIEADRHDECIARAVGRFRLTGRQVEVLLHVLEGASAPDVARELQISEYTAQGYIKTLLLKTSSRNRASMVAKILDWPARPPGDKTKSAER